MTTTTQKRARKGGETGANGEWYEGGKYINTVQENRKKEGSDKSRPTCKQQWEPYKWSVAPEGKSFAIFHVLVGAYAEYVDRYAPEKGIKPSEGGVRYFGEKVQHYLVAGNFTVTELCEAYNRGERWA